MKVLNLLLMLKYGSGMPLGKNGASFLRKVEHRRRNNDLSAKNQARLALKHFPNKGKGPLTFEHLSIKNEAPLNFNHFCRENDAPFAFKSLYPKNEAKLACTLCGEEQEDSYPLSAERSKRTLTPSLRRGARGLLPPLCGEEQEDSYPLSAERSKRTLTRSYAVML